MPPKTTVVPVLDLPAPQVRVPRLAALDRLCALLIAPPLVSSAFVVQAQAGTLDLVGAASCSFPTLPSQFQTLWQGREFVELHRLADQPGMRNHPLVDGTLDRWRSILLLPLPLGRGRSGFAGLASRQDRDPFTPLERKALYHAAKVAAASLKAEMALRQAGSGLLSALEGLRE